MIIVSVTRILEMMWEILFSFIVLSHCVIVFLEDVSKTFVRTNLPPYPSKNQFFKIIVKYI